MSDSTPTLEGLRVLMMPDYRIDNPYQTLLAKAVENEGVKVLFPFGYRRIFPIFRAIKTHTNKIDVLHLHWLSPYIKGNNKLTKSIYAIKFLIDILLAKQKGIKLVWTVHNYTSHDSHFIGLEEWIQTFLIKLADQIIFHNTLGLKYFSQTYQLDKSKIAVIPIGDYRGVYKSPIDKSLARKALDLPLSGHIYLNLGMLRPYKGIERLLQVWQDNRKLLGKSTLLIAGKAGDQAYEQKLATQASKTEGVILHTNFIEDDRIHLFFSAADVVVLPFERILTSSSLILAMSYDKPVIAPRTDGILETLGAADWLLYEPEDQQGLLHALKASTQTDLSVLSQLVKQECDRLNWGNIGKQTQQVYQAILIS